MNILHILPSSNLGGSELCAIETIQALSMHSNYVIFPSKGDLINKLSPLVADSVVIEKNNWWITDPQWSQWVRIKNLISYFKSSQKIKKYIHKNKIDIVITHTLVVPSGAIAAKRANIPHIWYIQEYGDLDHDLKFNFGKKRTLYWINRLSDIIVVNSKSLKEYYSQFIPEQKIEYIYQAVEFPISEPQRRKTIDSLSIVMIGNIATGKNQAVALKALSILKEQNIFPKITFIGDRKDNYLQHLQNIITENNLTTQVEFQGITVTPWEYLKKADVALVCSRNEAFGRVTIEGMKSGKLMVVSKASSGKELIQDQKNGFLFDPENAQDLASILGKIWSMENIAEITEKSNAYSIENFSIKKYSIDLNFIISKFTH